MPQVIADRFVRSNATWIDLATGCSVQLRVAVSGSRRDELEWNSKCTTLAGLRHPLINALIDYGSVDRNHRFEAYETRPAIVLSRRTAQRAVAHVMRFVRAHEIALARSDVDFVLRRVEAGRSIGRRTIGVILQHRPAFEALSDALDAASPAGLCAVSIQGASQSGLRTTRLLTARAARLHGYVPIAPAVVVAFPWVPDYVSGRHVCVLGTTEDTRAGPVRSFFTRLSVESPRRHLVLRFDRSRPEQSSKIVILERMGVTAMTGMIFADAEQGPLPDEIFAAARAADGRPGNCLERLGAGAYEPIPTNHFVVHELPQSYGTYAPPSAMSTSDGLKERRTSGVVRRAVERSESLVARGRHSAAERVLSRALRVHTGRGASAEAAQAALQLGYLALDRGRIDRATRSFHQAREADPESPAAWQASIGLGLSWIEDGRLVEAEAVLRTAAATTTDNEIIKARASAALSRCLYWMGRLDEAMVALEGAGRGGQSPEGARVAAMRSRILLAEGQIPAAVRSARLAAELAPDRTDLGIRAGISRALGAAVAAAGDDRAARTYLDEGLKAASAAHLPLMAARLRLTLAEVQGGSRRDDMRRLVRRVVEHRYPPLLQAAARAVLARLERVELDATTRAFIAASGAVMIGKGTLPPVANPVAELESFLNVGHTASDDRCAIDRSVEMLHERLRATTVVVVVSAPPGRRVLSSHGRPWHGEPNVAWRAVDGGLGVPVNSSDEPGQAAEPVRYCGEIIGAVAARWTAGAAIDVARVSSLLRVGALAIAAHVRAILDRSNPPSTTPAWEDLLGDSPPACTLRESIVRAARAPFPVLIQGESGSGKELVARAIHELGFAPGAPLLCTELRRPVRRVDRGGAVRACARRIHRRRRRTRRALRGRRRRDRCFSTKSANCRRERRPSCSACFRTVKCGESAKTSRAVWTSASSRQPTVDSIRKRPPAVSARISDSARRRADRGPAAARSRERRAAACRRVSGMMRPSAWDPGPRSRRTPWPR